MLPDSADETQVADETLAYIKITSVKPVSVSPAVSTTTECRTRCLLRSRHGLVWFEEEGLGVAHHSTSTNALLVSFLEWLKCR